MPSYRAVLKKTAYFKKGVMNFKKNNSLKGYLARYVDEIGKAASKSGENIKERLQKTEKALPKKRKADWLLPDEVTGSLWTGGFLGEERSPSNSHSHQQKGWIRRFGERWLKELEAPGRNRRMNDGFRFIVSLDQLASEQLVKSGVSMDQALREIWRTTMELYREKHGFTDPGGELGWVAGAHHDTDNTHIHITLFPTTKDNRRLHTNTRKGPDGKTIDDLGDIIGLVNIAAELFWREHLPFERQALEYRKAIIADPSEEPPLPNLEEFGRRGGSAVPGRKAKEEEIEGEINTTLAVGTERDDIARLFGRGRTATRLKQKAGPKKGYERLKAMLAIGQAWTRKNPPIWATLRTLSRPTSATPEAIKTLVQNLQTNLPDECHAIDQLTKTLLENEFGPDGKAPAAQRALVHAWKTKGVLWAKAVVDLASGIQTEPTPEECIQGAKGLAESFETKFAKVDPASRPAVWKEGTSQVELRAQELSAARYRRILRAINTLSDSPKLQGTIGLIETLITGATRLARTLVARSDEVRCALQKEPNGTISPRRELRDWKWDPVKKDVVASEEMGQPWPTHLDPDTILERLKAGKIPPSITKETTDIQTTREALENPDQPWEQKASDNKESEIQGLIRTQKEQRRKRRARVRERVKPPEKSEPEQPS